MGPKARFDGADNAASAAGSTVAFVASRAMASTRAVREFMSPLSTRASRASRNRVRSFAFRHVGPLIDSARQQNNQPFNLMITRRTALKTASAATAALAAAATFTDALAQAPAPTGPFTLAPLPYANDALEPHIDAATMGIHHGRHHAAYVAGLNRAVAGTDLAKKSVEDIVRGLATAPENIRTGLRNHGGGHLNHTLFWRMMKKGGGGQPKGALASAMEKKFGGFDKFREAFTASAMGQFGSGWAWLSVDDKKELRIEATANQDSPLTAGRMPLLGVDVWEHAYYLKYQNKRADYVAAFFNVIDWDFVAERFGK